MIDMPAFDPQACGDLSIPIPAILLGQPYDGETKSIFILGLASRSITLSTAGLVQYLAGATFTAAKALTNMDYRVARLFWA